MEENFNILQVNTKILWTLKGKGNWVVEDTIKKVKYLFRTKKEALSFSKTNKLSTPCKR